MKSWTLILMGLLALAPEADAGTVIIEAGRDVTLFENGSGALAAGAGPAIFAGRTDQTEDGVRRALLYFDVAANVPAHAEILSARLVLHVVSTTPGSRAMSLHRMKSDWGEGGSFGGGGRGAPAAPGDATWLHAFHPDAEWRQPGGDFLRRGSAERMVHGLGPQVWDDPRLIHDVRLWLQAPKANFGWLLMGDESARRTARRFVSRNSLMAPLRPRLEVEYRRRNGGGDVAACCRD